MATKHFRLKVQGDPAADQIHAAVGRHGGQILRVHRERGETHVYFAGDRAGDDYGKSLQGAGKAEEVSADEVTRF